MHIGANLTLRDVRGRTALMWAARWADLDLISTLIAAGRANIFVHHVCRNIFLLPSSMEQQIFSSSNIITRGIYTVIDLQLSVRAAWQILSVNIGANLNHRMGDGGTVLFQAAYAGKLDVLKAFIELGEKHLVHTIL